MRNGSLLKRLSLLMLKLLLSEEQQGRRKNVGDQIGTTACLIDTSRDVSEAPKIAFRKLQDLVHHRKQGLAMTKLRHLRQVLLTLPMEEAAEKKETICRMHADTIFPSLRARAGWSVHIDAELINKATSRSVARTLCVRCEGSHLPAAAAISSARTTKALSPVRFYLRGAGGETKKEQRASKRRAKATMKLELSVAVLTLRKRRQMSDEFNIGARRWRETRWRSALTTRNRDITAKRLSKDGPWLPVAIWTREGKQVARVAGDMVDPLSVWTWVATTSQGLTHCRRSKTGRGPGDAAPVSMGDNKSAD